MKDPKHPVCDRDCPKCRNTQAYGPEYRRGIKGDEDLGEHLRYYCTVCRYMTAEPTKDQDTEARRAELAEAFNARRARPVVSVAVDIHTGEQHNVEENFNRRDRDIDTVRRTDTRRPYGWRG